MASADLPIRLSWKWASAARDSVGYRRDIVNPSSASRAVKSRLIQTLSRGERSLLSGFFFGPFFILKKGLLSARGKRREPKGSESAAERFPPVAAGLTGLDALEHPCQLSSSLDIYKQIWELGLKM